MLIVIGTIPTETCYPSTLQALIELIAPYLDAGTSGEEGGATTKTLYIQTTQPTGVPEEVMWFEPVSRIVRFYGKAPGEPTATWKLQTFPAGTLTGSLLATNTVEYANLSTAVQAMLNAVAASTSSAVLRLQEPTGGGSNLANFLIMSDGSLRAMGKNVLRKNGTGTVAGIDDPSVFPKRSGFLPPLNGDTVAKVYTMQAATFVVTTNGQVYASGDNTGGQLGLNDTTSRVIFSLLNQAYFGGDAVAELAIGTGVGTLLSCYARTTAGNVYSWGHNYFGQLGQGGATTGVTATLAIPTLVSTLSGITKIVSAGAAAAVANTKVACYALKSDGTVFGCGYNADGNLGLGTTANHSTFIQYGTLTGVVDIAVAGDGGHITFYAQTSTGAADGYIYGSGYNNKGQIGDGSTTNRTVPTISLSLPGNAISEFRCFGSGANFVAFAVVDDGTLWAWGSNANHQLGMVSGLGTADVLTPTAPNTAGLYHERVRLGGSAGLVSSAILVRSAGWSAPLPQYNLYAAGSNSQGNLGHGGAGEQINFTQVLLDTDDISDFGFGSSHSSASLNTCALLIRLNNGGCLSTGYDGANIGQLGVDPTPNSISVPAFVNF